MFKIEFLIHQESLNIAKILIFVKIYRKLQAGLKFLRNLLKVGTLKGIVEQVNL